MEYYNSNKKIEQFCSIINKLQIDYIKIIEELKNEVLKSNKKNKILENIALKAIENAENSSQNNKESSQFYIDAIEKMKEDIKSLLKINENLSKNYSKSVLQNNLLELELKEKKEIIAYFEKKNYELFIPNYSSVESRFEKPELSNDIIDIKNRLKKILKNEDSFLSKINHLSDILLNNDFIFNSVPHSLLHYIKEIDVNTINNEKDAYHIFIKIFNDISKTVDLHYV